MAHVETETTIADAGEEGLQLAESYFASRLISEAAETFQSVLEKTGDSRALMGLARCMYHRRRLHEALSYLQELEARDPEYPEMANNMGVILFEMGLLDRARENFERASQESPDNPLSWLNLLDLARKQEDRSACERYCQRLLQVDPGNSEAISYLEQHARDALLMP